jgi:hypothetical protein
VFYFGVASTCARDCCAGGSLWQADLRGAYRKKHWNKGRVTSATTRSGLLERGKSKVRRDDIAIRPQHATILHTAFVGAFLISFFCCSSDIKCMSRIYYSQCSRNKVRRPFTLALWNVHVNTQGLGFLAYDHDKLCGVFKYR